MRVIIPAAGKGTRLIPLSHFCPKCLVEVKNKPLLYYLLTQLKLLKVDEVIIVTGYLAKMIEEYVTSNSSIFPKVVFIYNKDYETTNSIVSIALTRDYWESDFCIIDSDLLIKEELVEQLVNCKETCLIVDNSKPIELMDMKVKVENGHIKYMDKFLLRKETFGEFFGLSRWTPQYAVALNKVIDDFLRRNEKNVWYEFVIRALAEDMDIPVFTCTSELWYEIDNMTDYEAAETFLSALIPDSKLP